MRNGNDYAHFLCEMSSLLKKGAKISMKSLKAFDKGFDEDKADKIWLFPFLIGELIIHHELDTFDKQIDFLTKNFERDFSLVSKFQIKSLDELLVFLTRHFEKVLLPYFRHYFIQCPESVNFVEGKKDIIKIDNELDCGELFIHLYLKTSTKSFYYMSMVYYLESLNDPTDLSKNTFVTRLRMFDKLNPDKNHITKCIKLMVKEFTKDTHYKPEEIIKRVIDYFSYEETIKRKTPQFRGASFIF